MDSKSSSSPENTAYVRHATFCRYEELEKKHGAPVLGALRLEKHMTVSQTAAVIHHV